MKYYRFCATLDSRTSVQCRAKDGKIFPVDDAHAGVNLPPLHPHCRSTVVASLKADSKARGERVARNDDGSIVHIPADVDYKHWKDSVVQNTILMYRHKNYTHRYKNEDGSVSIDRSLYNKITKPLIKKGADIRIADEEWKQHLKEQNASTVTIGSVIVFSKNATVSDVLEECCHFEQNLKHLNDYYGEPTRSILNEIVAKKYLLSLTKKYKIPSEEIELTKKQLADYTE